MHNLPNIRFMARGYKSGPLKRIFIYREVNQLHQAILTIFLFSMIAAVLILGSMLAMTKNQLRACTSHLAIDVEEFGIIRNWRNSHRN